jgi:hypothetical protein
VSQTNPWNGQVEMSAKKIKIQVQMEVFKCVKTFKIRARLNVKCSGQTGYYMYSGDQKSLSNDRKLEWRFRGTLA